MASKDDGQLYDFVRQFADSLAVEYRFVEEVAHGLADTRPDAIQRHVSLLCNAVNFAANAAPMGSGLVSFITHHVQKFMQDQQNTKTEKGLSGLSKHTPDKRTFLFQQIANEVMYRYGAAIVQFIENAGSDNTSVALDRLARTGAIRVIYYSLKRGVGFEHCEKLVRGMVEGFDGFPERDMLQKLTHGAISLLDVNRRPVELTCEGLYTRCGFMTPGSLFWIHSDFDRQSGKDGKVSGYVQFTHPPGSGRQREDRLVPRYGYVSMPKKTDPIAYGFRKHHPTTTENVHVALSMRFRYRYVGPEHIVHYLAAMKAQAGKDDRVDFNTWLSQGQHAREFHLHSGTKVKALLRDVIDFRLLEQNGVDFADGMFRDVDFSYCTFRSVTIANMQRARLIGCHFIGCTATGTAISGADLSLSTIDNCKFEGLSGILTLNYGSLSGSSFAGCTFTVSNFVDMDYDEATLQSFSTSYAKTATGGAGGNSAANERLYEMLLETKMKQAEMAQLLKEKEDAMRQQELDRQTNRDLLNSLRETGSQKEKQQSQRVATVEEKIAQLKQRLDAYDSTTLGRSMELIRPLPTVESNPITKIFEAVFFVKPMKLLKLLQKNPQVVKWASLPRSFTYSTSGTKGEDGTNGENGQPGGSGGGAGTDGVNGVNGQHGTSAQPNTVCLMSVPEQRIFVVSPKASDVDSTVLPLYDGSVRVHLFAMGGAGGKGGDGGKGGNGQNGLNGRDATSSSTGTSGTGGGNGGRGGNGGMGGNAGHSADITVLVKEEDMDLLSLLGKVENGKAQGGPKGNFGLGGAGGIGGRGGSSYSGYDGERHYTNAGGMNGPNGVAGMNGRDGQPGQDGQPGNLLISVVNTATGEVEEFPSIYKLQLTKVSPFHSISGIIEPGQTVRMMSYRITNNGGMPTPLVELIVGMQGNSYILLEDKRHTWSLREKVYPNNSLDVEEPLPFKIATGLKPALLTETLYIPTELKMWAKFPRTNVEFADFQRDKIPISVMNPLEVSLVAGARATVFDWQVPVTITVRNKTRIGFGSAAAYARRVRVTIELGNEGGEGHMWHTNGNGLGTAMNAFSLGGAVQYDLDYIAPQSEFVLAGTIALSPSSAKLYDQITLKYSLALGDVENPLAEAEMEVIQTKSHTLQVGEYCQPIADSDCMLIVSGTTTLEEVEGWRAAFKKIGFTLCVFNVSLYHGASYKFPSFNICSELAGRIVVILNSPFYRDDDTELLNKVFYPLDYLEQSEMFEAARRHGVRTYIVNYSTPAAPSTHHANYQRYFLPMAAYGLDAAERDKEAFDGRNILAEAVQEQEATREERLPENYEYVRVKLFRALFKPKETDFDNRMTALAERLQKIRPDRTYYLAKAYQSAVKGATAKGLLFKRYDCGHIEVRRGLDTTYACMASTSVRRGQAPHTVTNEFVLLKLLPFSKKLELFTGLDPAKSGHFQVSLAILSDIADEQNVFLASVREQMVVFGGKKERVGGWLSALTALEKWDFSDLCQIPGGVDALTLLLHKLCFMASQYNKAHMIKSNFLARAVLDACFNVMKGYLGITTEEEFKEKVATYNAAQQLSKDDDLVAKYRDPHGCSHEVLFNHWCMPASNLLEGTQTLNTPPTLSLMTPTLADMRGEGVFAKAVAFFSKAPLYHIQPLPSLYAVPPDVELLTEGVGRKQCYFAHGEPAV